MKGSGRSLILGTITEFAERDWGKHEKRVRYNRSPGRDLNPVSPEYKSTVLTIQLRLCMKLPKTSERSTSKHLVIYQLYLSSV
jgi:hypothetical protein